MGQDHINSHVKVSVELEIGYSVYCFFCAKSVVFEDKGGYLMHADQHVHPEGATIVFYHPECYKELICNSVDRDIKPWKQVGGQEGG